ncbi:MAG: RsmE family RNA methyltransferase [bacterium]
MINIHRFFVKPENINENNITILDEEFYHLHNVLRLKINDKILICDNTGKEYIVVLQKISNSYAEGKIENCSISITEPKVKITLAQSIPKAKKMDFIIEKNTELGITQIIPLITHRCVVNIKNEILRYNRWEEIAKNAAKQSQRAIIPKIEKITSIKELDLKEYDLIIVPYENEKNNLKNILKNLKEKIKNIIIFIGPEGGFEKEEIMFLQEQKGISVSLGKRILKTETASITTLSIILYELGEL